MKNLFEGLRSKTYTFKDVLWLLIPAILLIVLPLFIWAAVTQRLEIRKRAASYPPPGTNPVVWMTDDVSLTADTFYIYTNGQYFWGNSPDVQVHSDPSNSGDPNYTTLEVIWHETPGNLAIQTEMRLFIYFRTDGKTWWADEIRTYNGRIPGDWVYYYGRFFERPVGQHFTGTIDLTSSQNTYNSYTGRIHFGNLQLLPFLRNLPVPSVSPCGTGGTYCRTYCTASQQPVNNPGCASGEICCGPKTSPTPIPICGTGGTYCQALCNPNQQQVQKPGCSIGQVCCGPAPTPTCIPRPACLDAKPACKLPEDPRWCAPGPSPTPPPGCRYVQVECIQAPCNPILVCPTPTPIVSQPPGTCQRGTPYVTVDKQSQTGNPGQTLTYQYSIKNTDSTACGATTFSFRGEIPSGWASIIQSIATINPGQTVTVPMYVTSAATAADGTYTVNLVMTSAAPYHYMRIPSTYTVQRAATSQTLDIRFKFAGVTTDAARNAKVIVHVVTQTRNLVTPPLPVTYLGNGIYGVVFQPNPSFPAGEKVYFLVKGEKHTSGKFCLQSGQTNPCGPNVWITMPTVSKPVFDFTGMPLRPGDVYPQNYITNNEDYTRVRSLLSKPSAQLTAQDLLVGDLNYDKVINGMDILLIRQTLDTQYDPS